MSKSSFHILVQYCMSAMLFMSIYEQAFAVQNTNPPKNIPLPLVKPLTNFSSTDKQNIKNLNIDEIISKSIVTSKKNIVSNISLKKGLDALDAQDIAGAITIRNAMAQNSLDQHILTWAIATSKSTDISSSEIAYALNVLQNWPNTTIIRENYERALARENNESQFILDAFAKSKPISVAGMVLYGQALIDSNQTAKAQKIIGTWWRTAILNANDEKLVLQKLGDVLSKNDHLQRMRAMLYAYRLDSAKRVSKLANAESLYNGFAAVTRNKKNALAKLNATNSYFHKDPTYLFAQIQYYRRDGQYEKAAKLMLKAPKDAKSLIDPDAWWVERRVLSREMLDLNNPQLAYQLAAAHSAESPIMAADAEFHAGWYALRFLNNPQTAFTHFSKIAQISASPISLSRAYYWLGRTVEAQGNSVEAQNYYQKSAHYGTTYYGQLAQSKLGVSTLEIPYPKPSDIERHIFTSRESVMAIKRLQSVDYGNLANDLYRELGESLNSPGELALLAVMAENQNNHYISLKIGKNAVARGLDVGALSHPLGAIPETANISASGKALAYAIARQESEFKIDAKSSAGAVGILQLLPKTAKSIASRHSIAWSSNKLSSDAGYNATLGAHFLGEQLERFNGSYILTFIGYNAGPSRANQWVERYGDPRGQNIDKVVDWVERIPYTETRNYVMRVMENYEVYKARISGATDIATDLVSGRSNP